MVLVVDDHAETRDLIRQVLEEVLGYRVVVAINGREAVRLAESIQPSLVLMDMMMPEMDGIEATRAIKAQAATQAIPVIALTAVSRPAERAQASQAGCADFVEKPFDLDHLISVVNRHVPAT